MSKLAIVTDSTSDLPKDLVSKNNITSVPLSVIFKEATYLDDGKEISIKDFYKKLKSAEDLPTTTQPTGSAERKTGRTDHCVWGHRIRAGRHRLPGPGCDGGADRRLALARSTTHNARCRGITEHRHVGSSGRLDVLCPQIKTTEDCPRFSRFLISHNSAYQLTTALC